MKWILSVLGLISLLIIPAITSAATFTSDPIASPTEEWTPSSAVAHYTLLDDGVRSPTEGNMADNIWATVEQQVADILTLNLPTGNCNITSVVVWGFYSAESENRATVAIDIGGLNAWSAEQNVPNNNGLNTWFSLTFNGDWDTTGTETLRVRLTHPTEQAVITIYSLYSVETYTSSAPSTTMKFIKKKKGITFLN